MFDLITRLKAEPHGFDLFQAISLLERIEPNRAAVGTSLGVDEAVRLSAHVALAFPPSDIESVAVSDRPGPPVTVSTGVMTLAGATGPLPLPFTEQLVSLRRSHDRTGLEFLDIFNQRLLGFLYRSRRKHRIALGGANLMEAPSLRVLDALSGLGRAEHARAPDGQQGWLRHAGLQGAAPRSMAALLALVRDRLGIHFLGRQFVGAWHRLDPAEHAVLGGPRPTALNGSAALGARCWDQEACISLSTPPLSHFQFRALLPGGRQHRLLAWLVARHQQRETRAILQLNISAPPTTCLSAGCSLPPRLGLSAWLGTGPSVQSSRFVLSCESANGN